MLKPCPFCGSNNVIVEEGYKIWTGNHYGKPISYSVVHFCEDTRFSIRLEMKGKTEEEAIELWNKRV